MTTAEKLQLNANSVLVKLFVSVSGISRRKLDEKEQRDGKALETTREVLTRVHDTAEAEKAKKLVNVLRALTDKYVTSVLGLSLMDGAKLGELRTEIAPIRAQIETHNASAKFHAIQHSLICAPIALNADPAAITEVLRQVADELKAAAAFFDPAKLETGATFDSWKVPLDNWRDRTRNLGQLFPNIVGQCITDALDSVKDLRKKVADVNRANEKVGQTAESAMRAALVTVITVPGALGLIESAIGLVVVTDADAKARSDASRESGASTEVH